MEQEKQELETFTGHGGQLRYRCPERGCEYDSYLPALVKKHWDGTHAKEHMQEGRVLFDAEDKEIEETRPRIIYPASLRNV